VLYFDAAPILADWELTYAFCLFPEAISFRRDCHFVLSEISFDNGQDAFVSGDAAPPPSRLDEVETITITGHRPRRGQKDWQTGDLENLLGNP
jgi:hypothetical protein